MRSILFLTISMILTIGGACSASEPIRLEGGKTTFMKVGEVAQITTAPLHKNIEGITVRVQGDAVKLLTKEGRPSQGYRFRFKAVKTGDATVIETIRKYCKKDDCRKEIEFRIRVGQ